LLAPAVDVTHHEEGATVTDEYRYSLLQFVPRIGRGESVNVGVIVVDDATGQSTGVFLPDPSPKIGALAPGFNVAGIGADIETIRRRLGACSEAAPNTWIRSSEQLRVLAGTMRNQLQFSEPHPYAAASLGAAAQKLYEEFVRPIGAAVGLESMRAAAP